MDTLDHDDHRRFKDDLYGAFASVGKALASPKRLELIDLLAQGQRTVQALADEMDASVANTSQHLQTLREARLVEVDREGTYAHYRLADDNVLALWKALRDLATDRLPEVRAIVEDTLGERTGVHVDDPHALLEEVEREGTLLVDVRPSHEYDEGHLPGARSLPIDEIDEALDELPRDKRLLVYCRGPFCVYSDEAVAKLRRAGYDAERVEPGLADWRPKLDTLTPQEENP